MLHPQVEPELHEAEHPPLQEPTEQVAEDVGSETDVALLLAKTPFIMNTEAITMAMITIAAGIIHDFIFDYLLS